MGGGSFQIIILLILAIVIFMRLMRELGKRDGHEPELKAKKPELKLVETPAEPEPDTEIIEGDEISAAISQARTIEPSFRVEKFLVGSKAAYEMILMSFLEGDVENVKAFVDPAVYDGFNDAITAREKAGHKIDAKFIGIKDIELKNAEFDEATGELTLGVEYIAELNRVIYDKNGKIIEGAKDKIETEIDHWQFARVMGTDNPNWELVATGE